MPKAIKILTKHWFSGAVIPNPNNSFEVIAFECCFDNDRSPEVLQIKLPGGSKKENADRRDTTPEETLCREVVEEVFKNRQGEVIDWDLLCLDDSRPEHSKYFFLVTKFSGDLRQEDLFEEEHGRVEDGPRGQLRTERTGRPEFMSLESLARVIFRSHAPALRAYCERLGKESVGLAFNAMKVTRILDDRGI